MSTFAGALGRGLAGYAANRERAMAREEELAQQQRAEARQAERDKQADLMMAAQLESMRVSAARNAAQDTRQGEQDRNAAIDSGLRDTEPTRMMGTLMSGAANIGVGGTGASLGALRSFGNVNTAAASGPQYSVGGKAMSRAARSLEQQDADRKAAEATARRTQDREWQVTDRDQIEKRADARAAADRASRRETGVNMQVIQTADGPMAFNPRTGETKPIMANGKPVQAAVGGMPKLTEGQRRVGGLVEMAEAERKKMEELGTPGMFDRAMAKVPFGLGEPLMSNKGQQYLSAAEAFTRPYLYALSGANANDGEVRSTARQSVPGIFTRRDTDADMKARRARQVDGMRTIAGQSGDVSRDESPQAAKFRADARAEGYSDEQIDAELRRMGIIR
jgi:hypothetical protein